MGEMVRECEEGMDGGVSGWYRLASLDGKRKSDKIFYPEPAGASFFTTKIQEGA